MSDGVVKLDVQRLRQAIEDELLRDFPDGEERRELPSLETLVEYAIVTMEKRRQHLGNANRLNSLIKGQRDHLRELFVCSDCGASGSEVTWCRPESSYALGHIAGPDDPCGPMVIRAQQEENERLRNILETKVAQFMCPVHGNAACPEEYMLLPLGAPQAVYRKVWKEDMRCGQRFKMEELPPDIDPEDRPCRCGIEYSKHIFETHSFVS